MSKIISQFCTDIKKHLFWVIIYHFIHISNGLQAIKNSIATDKNPPLFSLVISSSNPPFQSKKSLKNDKIYQTKMNTLQPKTHKNNNPNSDYDINQKKPKNCEDYPLFSDLGL